MEEAFLQHAVLVVAQQRAVLCLGEPCLEVGQVACGEQVPPLVVRHSRAVAAGVGTHHRIRCANTDEPRCVRDSGRIAFQLHQVAQVRRGARAFLGRGQRHKGFVAAVLQKRLGLGSQAPVCSGVA